MNNEGTGYKVFTAFNMIFLILLCIITLFPIVYVVGRSLATEAEIAKRSLFLIPHEVNFNAYKYILFGDSPVLRGYKITVFRTMVGTALNVFMTSLLAYGLSRRYLPGRTALTFIIFFTMLFNGGIIPSFLVVRGTGLMNSIWSMIIPGLISTWNTLILRNFFMTIPDSLEESAKLDGCNDIGILFRIVFPLSIPAITTIGLFYAVGHWNAWFDSMLYITDHKKWTLQLLLRQILVEADIREGFQDSILSQKPPIESVRTASIVVATVPILCIYPFIQKYFVKGVMIGSVKG